MEVLPRQTVVHQNNPRNSCYSRHGSHDGGARELHRCVPSKSCVFLVAQLPPPLMDTAAITAYIKLNPQVRCSKLVVKDTRTMVAEVLEMLANVMSAADI